MLISGEEFQVFTAGIMPLDIDGNWHLSKFDQDRHETSIRSRKMMMRYLIFYMLSVSGIESQHKDKDQKRSRPMRSLLLLHAI